MDMLLGFTRGTIGETSVIAIMIGAMYLILMGVSTCAFRDHISYLLLYLLYCSAAMVSTHSISPHICAAVD